MAAPPASTALHEASSGRIAGFPLHENLHSQVICIQPYGNFRVKHATIIFISIESFMNELIHTSLDYTGPTLLLRMVCEHPST